MTRLHPDPVAEAKHVYPQRWSIVSRCWLAKVSGSAAGCISATGVGGVSAHTFGRGGWHPRGGQRWEPVPSAATQGEGENMYWHTIGWEQGVSPPGIVLGCLLPIILGSEWSLGPVWQRRTNTTAVVCLYLWTHLQPGTLYRP